MTVLQGHPNDNLTDSESFKSKVIITGTLLIMEIQKMLR